MLKMFMTNLSRLPMKLKYKMPLRPQVFNYTTDIDGLQNHLTGDYEKQPPRNSEDIVNVVFVDREGERIPVVGKIDDNVCALALINNIQLEGACGGNMACVTCHVYLDEEYYDKLPEMSESEEDMLTTAMFLKENSRLGCQLVLSKDMEGMTIYQPNASRNFKVDDYKPK